MVNPLPETTRKYFDICTEKLAANSSRIEEADRQALRDIGFTDRDIWDIASVTGFFNMTNRIASATAMVPNADYHGVHR